MSVLKAVRNEFQPGLILRAITAGAILAAIDLSMEIALGAVIFSGDLSPFLARGIGLMVFGAFVMGIVTALATSLPGMIAIPQDTPAVILALVAAGIAASMRLSSPDAVLATVMAAIGLTSLLMAAFFFLLGRFKASGFVRYIPYPVVGGFLAGTGWLLVKGGMGVMVSLPLTMTGVLELLAPNRLLEWVPGAVFGVVLLLLLRRWDHFWITPAALGVAIALFYGYLLAAHISVAEASARGWLPGPFPAGSLYQPLSLSAYALIDWHAILMQSSQIASVLVLSTIALLLNASGLEVTYKQDVDLNRELITAGLLNLAAAAGGSPVGYQTLSMSALSHRLGARTRLVNIVFSLLCGVVLLFGASLVSYFPNFMLGGMTVYLGLVFLVDWLVDARRSLPALDYLLVWAIVLVIAAVGFLQGVGVGILIAAILFVVTYSRVNVVKNALNGRVFHSHADRPEAHRELLIERGERIFILRLQGFIFFGTVQGILEKVRARLDDKSQQALCYLVLDFQRVTRLDSSAVFGITRLRQLAMANGVWMVWTHVSPSIRGQLELGGLFAESGESFILLPTLDHGMEWSEDQLLAAQGITDLTGFMEPMQEQLRRALPGLQDVERLLKYLERREIAQGEYLMRAGEPGDSMYFVEGGLLSVQVETPDGEVVRVWSTRGGTTVGEIGLYLGTPRSATVVATRPTIVYGLSAQALETMRAEDPEAAALLHEWIARLLAERLADNSRTIQALMD